MEKFIKSLEAAGFKSDAEEGHDFGYAWAGISEDTRKKITFTKGDKTVIIERVPNAGGQGKHITIKQGGKELLFTNTGDVPSSTFMKEFFEAKPAK
jgi:hypothetical protein